MYNQFRVTQKQKTVIESQKTEVEKQKVLADDHWHLAEKQKAIVEEKNKEILDSINYARRIQSAILPPARVVKEYLKDSFILYKPKDVVAGDFYWMEKSGNKLLFAAADCTGHGVPGAMVSVVCNNALNRTVREYGLTDPGEILDKTREIVIEEFEKLLNRRTRFVSVSHVSNALGTVNPVERMIEMAHGKGVPVMIDGAQAAPHRKVNVQKLDCDFYAFSGHKLYGPTGIGILYGKASLLEAMPPYQGGGDMIRTVSFEKTTYNALPYKFEAGTPNIAGTIGLGAAIDYLNQLGLEQAAAYEHELLAYATKKVSQLPGVRIIGTAREKASVLSFVIDGVHPHDAGTILDQQGIAVRAGHHCAMPVMERFGIPATTRASFAFYNTIEEVDALVSGIEKVQEVFS
ncbi:MAG: aminotransferase class V-fold PLP-dependent enzyme [Acidobacteria bacterium]|nr:aminotransferase class V-fold PLP-dependent enzyme [Acidobacteriota bacterium]